MSDLATARTWLVSLRGARSQQEMAEEITKRGIPYTRSGYSLIELGLRDPSPEVAAVLADIFGVNMDVIFFGEGGFEVKQPSVSTQAEGGRA